MQLKLKILPLLTEILWSQMKLQNRTFKIIFLNLMFRTFGSTHVLSLRDKTDHADKT